MTENPEQHEVSAADGTQQLEHTGSRSIRNQFRNLFSHTHCLTHPLTSPVNLMKIYPSNYPSTTHPFTQLRSTHPGRLAKSDITIFSAAPTSWNAMVLIAVLDSPRYGTGSAGGLLDVSPTGSRDSASLASCSIVGCVYIAVPGRGTPSVCSTLLSVDCG